MKIGYCLAKEKCLKALKINNFFNNKTPAGIRQ